MNRLSIAAFLLFSSGLLVAENFILTPKKKKQPKISAADCCQQILREMHSFARINQYIGIIESIELAWVQDFFNNENDGIFKRATQEQLKRYMEYKQRSNNAREEYEKILHEERDFLKQFEHALAVPVKK